MAKIIIDVPDHGCRNCILIRDTDHGDVCGYYWKRLVPTNSGEPMRLPECLAAEVKED